MEKALGARLECVARFIPKCNTLADCGCDHGYVSIFAAQHGIVDKITASDINRGPLDNAEKEIAAAGQGDKISTVLTDGLDGIEHHDCVVIAGMGGEMISDIIERAPWTKENCTLVLQPMTRSEILREYLYNNGFGITKESIVTENGHMYCVIAAKHIGKVSYELYEKYISRAAMSDPLAAEYTDRVIMRLEYEFERRNSSGALSEAEKEKRRLHIESLMEMRKTL